MPHGPSRRRTPGRGRLLRPPEIGRNLDGQDGSYSFPSRKQAVAHRLVERPGIDRFVWDESGESFVDQATPTGARFAVSFVARGQAQLSVAVQAFNCHAHDVSRSFLQNSHRRKVQMFKTPIFMHTPHRSRPIPAIAHQSAQTRHTVQVPSALGRKKLFDRVTTISSDMGSRPGSNRATTGLLRRPGTW